MLDFSSSLFPGTQFHLRGGHDYHQLCHGHCHPQVRIVQKMKHFRTYQVSGAQRKKRMKIIEFWNIYRKTALKRKEVYNNFRTNRAKNVFTCFAATLLPTCFVARWPGYFDIFTINFFVGQGGAFSSQRRNVIFLITRDTIKGKEVEDPKCGPKLFARFWLRMVIYVVIMLYSVSGSDKCEIKRGVGLTSLYCSCPIQ